LEEEEEEEEEKEEEEEEEEPPIKRRRLDVPQAKDPRPPQTTIQRWMDDLGRITIAELVDQPAPVRIKAVDLALAIAAAKKI
jgi:hypothetical protein